MNIPPLTRSSLHRLYQRHEISRLPDLKVELKMKFKAYLIGFGLALEPVAGRRPHFHIDIAEVRTDDGKLYMFVAIDRTSKFVFVRLEDKANRKTASALLGALIKVYPYNTNPHSL